MGAEVIIPQTSWQVVLSLRANAGSAMIASKMLHACIHKIRGVLLFVIGVKFYFSMAS